jgi:hypothetical protein
MQQLISVGIKPGRLGIREETMLFLRVLFDFSNRQVNSQR